ncbi:MAG: glutamine--fructose-6-phosphate aminotransferase [Candidatus Sungbacteria bacterium RIFCSPLOWO2_02_FULL_51_17]|uniref:Glutamine--fructose-6-phosphate aminotransferase [isomerizing] n=1 Tax=Candidatus Sungbacteria bacterium RIFCSPHIGHO2_02_FULL_51_29 TaxID=1802273 RepID=A0A1G2KVV6_9BACT|nr:MAG: glutamine--fructose-6-phosphate aminotransferase [Candidatus Sungbacteria bacterium RIFCSPHIGHO2_01_FULL_51_22]OHA03556.1 MAG: glutamine--fructose-6-phosphate aminotransferase [Candidatus Sungbacteria bacterium RIFCSPHIGHO2_02_FULL_51_29]OHA04978.1 MAG: glutamine--fructose-6-phosphate aminotransferase [Candidatus Sungbacteria bacterium RIFCSPLOWO2_01_FULL_51_34]OHA10799.1 MAG: glutamine--fructose-6-phosphate aminotransferase [Candidatus Sungbacteria bacterium RIFCSPLOWO2_02_FULL_51_17]
MCGIVGYIGARSALPILVDGIKSLEYRGYDSAGLALVTAQGVWSQRAVGRVINLEAKIGENRPESTLGLCHTRWATHGGVTEANAHPHTDCKRNIWLCHNGIIENFKELKDELKKTGHTFRSETDTEVIAHLIEEIRNKDNGLPFEEAVRVALMRLKGTYGIVALDRRDPKKLVAARNFSPLLLGLGKGEYIVASDASAVLKHTRDVVYLQDGDMAVLTPSSHTISDLKNNPRERTSIALDWSPEEAKKDGYPHFMLKEIFAQPEAIENSIRGRLIPKDGLAKLGGLAGMEEKLRVARRIIITACGTAYLAGRVGEYLFEEYASMPTRIDLASELRYRKPIFQEGDVMLVLSQSGETADTLAALAEAKQKGVLTLGIVNAVGSSIARETDAGVYQHIGPEIGVASTKAFTSQVAILALMTMLLGRSRDMSVVTGARIADDLQSIPNLIRKILQQSAHIKTIAKKYQKTKNFLYLGRKYNYPVALEGALKLKEISYAHAEGYSAGEMKHGPIAMIDKNFPSICVAPSDSVYEKNISNIQEVKARGGPVIAIATEGDKEIAELADDVIFIPPVREMLSPLLTVIPLQLFAYHFGVLRGHDVDKPRNLAKSVTVE